MKKISNIFTLTVAFMIIATCVNAQNATAKPAIDKTEMKPADNNAAALKPGNNYKVAPGPSFIKSSEPQQEATPVVSPVATQLPAGTEIKPKPANMQSKELKAQDMPRPATIKDVKKPEGRPNPPQQ